MNLHPSDIVAVGVVGSRARGTQRDHSDVDIVVLTTRKTAYTATDHWVEQALGQQAPAVRRAEWGRLSERRLRLPSGFEVDMGCVDPSWAATDP
ncbi:MAG: nucleotidyltransferase domain-containing protein, partial [Acidobacteria bacterium]|nr:nucleotidyltransferase domain-containing protein [Acidobacteriota bacterium]